MWTYEQSTGNLTDPEGQAAGTGYSGRGEGLNNPAMQDVSKVGPVPQGAYIIGPAQTVPKLGVEAMRLIPDPANVMYDRDGFFMHGDNVEMDHTASEGCIILPRTIREQVDASEDRRLSVVA